MSQEPEVSILNVQDQLMAKLRKSLESTLNTAKRELENEQSACQIDQNDIFFGE